MGIAEKSSGPASIKLLNIMEHRMTSKYLSRLLILVFGLALAKPAQAQDGPIGPSAGPIIAAIVVTAAAVVIVTVVVIHE